MYMGIKEDYYVKSIPRKDALRIVVEKHYLHRECAAKWSFGLFDKENNIKGVCIFGIPPSPGICQAICGESERLNVVELSRLYVDEGCPKNTESFLIMKSVNEIPDPIIISFAEIEQDHTGIIYQATNWLYTGISDPYDVYILPEKDEHFRHAYDRYGGLKNMREIFGDKLIKKTVPSKHRYIYFNCDKRRKRELLKKLQYPILPYPKRDSPVSHYKISQEQKTLV